MRDDMTEEQVLEALAVMPKRDRHALRVYNQKEIKVKLEELGYRMSRSWVQAHLPPLCQSGKRGPSQTFYHAPQVEEWLADNKSRVARFLGVKVPETRRSMTIPNWRTK